MRRLDKLEGSLAPALGHYPAISITPITLVTKVV
jgi:hypothetical protein